MGEDDKLDLSNHELEYFQSRLPRLNLLIHLDLSYNKIVNSSVSYRNSNAIARIYCRSNEKLLNLTVSPQLERPNK